MLTIALMDNAKFRKILTAKYPIILIDEYQDTDAGWVDSIKNHFLGQKDSPQFGFFGRPLAENIRQRMRKDRTSEPDGYR